MKIESMKKMDEKAQVMSTAQNFVVGFGVMILAVGVITYIVGQFSTGLTAGTIARNVTDELLLKIQDNVVFIGLILLVGLAVLIIGLVKGFQGRA